LKSRAALGTAAYRPRAASRPAPSGRLGPPRSRSATHLYAQLDAIPPYMEDAAGPALLIEDDS